MPTAAFTTLGCKVNQYETQKILESFELGGFEIVPFDQAADVYVINTCSVTSDAERKSRYVVRKAARQNEAAKVVVTGCAAQMTLNQKEAFADAHLVVPNPEKLETYQHFSKQFEGLATLAQRTPATQTRDHKGRTRATLKVQDGCSVMCSYCSIPYTRPGLRSRDFRDVLKEAQTLAEQGYHEAILTGVLIGAYDEATGSGGPNFDELVRILAKDSGLARLRISSIEMHQVTPAIVQLATEGVVVPHFHLPLQSGDTGVLSDMNRRYTQADYLQLCADLYRDLPDLTLTTDIMVGFPTESEERFQSSEHVCREARYLSAHVFTFSPRWGTPADQWGDPVSPQEKAKRRLRLMAITAETGLAHRRKFLGRTMRVLFEGKIGKDGLLSGLTDNYLPVKAVGSESMCRSMQWVRLDEEMNGAIHGEIVSAPGLRILTQ